jgi:hypothetical protein
MVRAFFLVRCVHALAVFAMVIEPSALEAAQFDVGVKANGLEIELVKPRYDGFSLRVRRHWSR